ncbi:MAG: hypothetical protein Q9182_005475 [Xanthomendoza sp. 2 TL-2023]
MESPVISARTVPTEEVPNAMAELKADPGSGSIGIKDLCKITGPDEITLVPHEEDSSDESEYYDCVEKPEDLKALEGSDTEGGIWLLMKNFTQHIIEMDEYRKSHAVELFRIHQPKILAYCTAFMDLHILLLQRRLLAHRLATHDCRLAGLTSDEILVWSQVERSFSKLESKLLRLEKAFQDWEEGSNPEELGQRFLRTQQRQDDFQEQEHCEYDKEPTVYQGKPVGSHEDLASYSGQMTGDRQEVPREGNQGARANGRMEQDESTGFDTVADEILPVTGDGAMPVEHQNHLPHVQERAEDSQNVGSEGPYDNLPSIEDQIEAIRRVEKYYQRWSESSPYNISVHKHLTALTILLCRRREQVNSLWKENLHGEHDEHYRCLHYDFAKLMQKTWNCKNGMCTLQENVCYMMLGYVFEREQEEWNEVIKQFPDLCEDIKAGLLSF